MFFLNFFNVKEGVVFDTKNFMCKILFLVVCYHNFLMYFKRATYKQEFILSSITTQWQLAFVYKLKPLKTDDLIYFFMMFMPFDDFSLAKNVVGCVGDFSD